MDSKRYLDYQVETVVKGWFFYFDQYEDAVCLLSGIAGKPVNRTPNDMKLMTAIEAAQWRGNVSCVVPDYSTESGIELLRDYISRLYHFSLTKLGKTSIRLYENGSPKSIQDKGIDGSNIWIVYSKWGPDPLLSQFPSASITTFDADPRAACIKAVKISKVKHNQ